MNTDSPDRMTVAGSWPDLSPDHKPLPCENESLPALGQQQQ